MNALLAVALLFSQAQPSGSVDSLIAVGTIESLKTADSLLADECKKNPGDYGAFWRAARAVHEYAAAIVTEKKGSWKDSCKILGKKGMALAERAIALDSGAVEGYFYYGLCVGIYAEGVSTLRALREGLKGRTQHNLEKAFAIDKGYLDGGPAIALGRYWAVIPWPYRDRKKALECYRAYQQVARTGVSWPRRSYYVAELLCDLGREHYEEAGRLLSKVAASTDTAWSRKAEKLLATLEK